MKACMIAYTFYENDNRVMRYAETLVKRGDEVDVIALRCDETANYECLNGVNVYKIQCRFIDEKGQFSYLYKLLLFFVRSAYFITKKHYKSPYDMIHVHSVPDFEVFATLIPKLKGAKIILDIHDIVPEFYMSKFKASKNSFFYRLLLLLERLSAGFADHVIIANHLWWETLVSRSLRKEKCTTILNYPDQSIFYRRPRTEHNSKFVIMYPGTVNWHQGLDIAVKAFALIKDEISNAEFHIYGGGQNFKPLLDLIEKHGLQERVLLKGVLPITEIANVMSSADLGIVPKRNDPFGGEAFSTKILEFMALGVPMVISKTKIDDYYFNDSVVKFFEPGDEHDLASSILLMANNKEIRKNYENNATVFMKDFNWENKKDEYVCLVDNLISDNK